MSRAARHLLLCILTIAWSSSAGQGPDILFTNNVGESIRAAENYIGEKDWDRALKQLEYTARLKDKIAVTYRLLGKVYLELGQFQEAVDNYEHSFSLDEKVSRAAFFECGDAWLSLGRADIAQHYYTRYEEMKDTRYANRNKESGLERAFDEMLNSRHTSCQLWAGVDSGRVTEWPAKLEGAVNTRQQEYMPAVARRGSELVFTRLEADGDENIYTSRLAKSGKWEYPRPLAREVHTPLNEGMAKFSAHGRSFLFAGCRRSDSQGGCDIYKAFIDSLESIEIHTLPGALNSPHWDSQPALSCNGKSIFFSSTRPGGYGGADIWVSHLLDDGTWSNPQNLGPGVNTEGDEEGPYIANDGHTLYFSSDGHPGYGRNDFFMSRLKSGRWSEAHNLGFPINSAGRELGIHLQEDGRSLFFASSRDGNMDLYHYTLPDSLQPAEVVLLEGEVYDLYSQKRLSGVELVVKSDQDGHVLFTDERGGFFVCLCAGKGYSFQVEHPGYEYYVGAQYISPGEHYQTPIPLEPKGERPPARREERRLQFFFPHDSHALTPTTRAELDDLVLFLREHREWQIEILGYADSSGGSEYNRKLSDERAAAIRKYLIEQGIASHTILKSEGQGALSASEASRRVDIILWRE